MTKVLKVNFNFANNEGKKNDFQNNPISIFEKTINIDDIENLNEVLNLDTFNYIYFSNPLVAINEDEVITIIKKMNMNNIKYANFTLKQINNIEINELFIPDFNDLFMNAIINVEELNKEKISDIFLDSKISKAPKLFVEIQKKRNGNGAWNFQPFKLDVLDPGEIKIILQGFLYLCETYSKDRITKAFGTDNMLIVEINKLVDNAVFENQLVGDLQTRVLEEIKKIVENLDMGSEIPNQLFYKLLKKSYYEEAIKSLSLYRSYNYWNNVEIKVTEERANNPLLNNNLDIRKTEMWKSTQKFRDLRISIKNKRRIIKKSILKKKSEKLKKKVNKPIWLISERRDTASDNSYYLYEYLRTKQNEIEPYYLINGNAYKAIEKLEALGKNNIVYFGTEKHELLLLAADKLITSFTIEETMLPFNATEYKKLYENELKEKDIISIQHGMIIHNISPYLSKKDYMVDYITANNRLEKKIIMDTLGFKSNEVLITGMARQDNLIKKTKFSRNILFMPTWQRALQHLKPAQFIESEYYKQIAGLVNNSDILNYLKENNLKIKVLMHPQFEKFASLLISNNELVEFLSLKEVEVPDLITDCRLLITDFSSVCVDFLFQKKNVIFFQYNKYASHHVASKEIQYSDIGTVVPNIDELLSTLQAIKENDYKLLPEFEKSLEELFDLKHDIREHIFTTIKSL